MEIKITSKNDPIVSIKELVSYRELFYLLALRDIKVRYKQTLLGVFWVVFQPLILTIIFTVFFNRVANITTGAFPYILFSFSGLVFWNFFSSALNDISNSLITNQSLVTKVYFPRLIIPVSTIIVGLIDFFISFAFILPIIFIFKVKVDLINILILIPSLLLLIIFLLGLGLFLSMLNAKFRDVRYVLPFFIQLLLFITPIIYPVGLVSQNLRWFLYLNPITGTVEMIRVYFLKFGTLNINYLLI